MGRITALFLLIALIGCQNEERTVTGIDSYTCDTHKIENSHYDDGSLIKYNIEVVTINNASFNSKRSIEILNDEKYFGGSNINFNVKKVSNFDLSVDTFSYRELRRMFVKSHSITLIIVHDDLVFKEEEGSKIWGVAWGIPELYNPSLGKPVIVIRETATLNAILAHEMGHVFGLLHSFQNDDMTNKGLNCYSGDKIPDTVTPHRESGVVNETCELWLPDYLDGFYTDAEKHNVVENPMSYSPFNCMKGFTKAQHERIKKIASINSRLQDAEIH